MLSPLLVSGSSGARAENGTVPQPFRSLHIHGAGETSKLMELPALWLLTEYTMDRLYHSKAGNRDATHLSA